MNRLQTLALAMAISTGAAYGSVETIGLQCMRLGGGAVALRNGNKLFKHCIKPIAQEVIKSGLKVARESVPTKSQLSAVRMYLPAMLMAAGTTLYAHSQLKAISATKKQTV